MPKSPRPSKEVAAVRQRILDEALDIITDYGYDGFTMRKLADRQGIAAKTIYNYFASKDEIFLHVRTKGFELLYSELLEAYNSKNDPFEKLRAMSAAYINFGLQRANYYDIMFIWNVPRVGDYTGSPLESLAVKGLRTSLKSAEIFTTVIKEISEAYGTIPNNKVTMYLLQLWAGLHGIVALHNNTLLSYLHERPGEILEEMSEVLLSVFLP
ncbi:TetR/AcrR family transcriptional regulator [Candidatus Poribacteria bacterium]|nr:TetR/AcrR family transcriptional regulator [Candidatus Poribacteria bacterium]